eukprot:TRINITY_DN3891_c0_g3_i1.p1 TRINITY_DN3891_c0_g3~~TRINITY_DN3891_c0_g3_i1.p1  ORF type:complete len:792 (-),score=144.58 TRINITY_DN3891_c0_g3_i1:2486-4861(-)
MNCRKLAVKILNRVLNEGAYSNLVLSKELNECELSDKDKSLLTELVYGVLRRKKTLDVIISNFVKDIKLMDSIILNILRVAIYQMNFLDKVPAYAACNEAVEEAKEISENDSKLVNGILRNFTKNPDDIEVPGNRIDEYAYKFSFEPWMIRLLFKQYGEVQGKKIMAGLNCIPKVSVRVNALKDDYDDVFEKLQEMEYDIEEGLVCPEAICIKGGKSIESNLLFNEGKITVQDESAMLIAPLLDLKENMKVLDLCSAPGGKTTHISEILNNTGEVYALDLYDTKLNLIRGNCERLGITNVKVSVNDATKLNADFISAFDRVLIDVPCSGIGIIRKKPEIKWNKTRSELKEMVLVQRKIMDNAWQYLKPGGILIYSTCTLNKEENEENIEYFIEKHRDCESIRPFIGKQDNLVYNKNISLTIMPNEYMDGFFVAKLQKKQVVGEQMNNLLDYTLDELKAWMIENNESAFRAKQVISWVYKNVYNFEDMKNIPQSLKEKLKTKFIIELPKIIQVYKSQIDGTEKFLLAFEDGNLIESVLMRYKHGNSICISTQIGCKMGCKFCASTLGGKVRDLTNGEILSEIIVVQNYIKERISHVVLMGSGEPLDNYYNVIKFLEIVSSEYSLNIGQRHITLSTCGIVPKIYELADEEMNITLALSLHAFSDEKRKEIMPIANKYSIVEILKACKYYINKTKRRITFEYALVKDVNDGKEDAKSLGKLLKGMLCHVNLIPVNEIKENSFKRSSKKTIDDFSEILKSHGIEVTTRREMGSDINAACGQLRRSYIETQKLGGE